MALRWLALVSMVSLAMGQSSTVPVATPSVTMAPSPSVTMAAMAPSVTPTPTPAPETDPPTMMPTMETTMGPTDNPVDLAIMNLTLTERFARDQASGLREEHFFCPSIGGKFLMDTPERDTTNTERVRRNWSIYLQYPVLAYLDSLKKMDLIGKIVALMNLGGLTGMTTSNVCIGTVDHYDVSLYTESVLINIYRRNYNMSDAPTPDAMNIAFDMGVDMAVNMSRMDLIQLFRGKRAIVINSNTYGGANQNVHPGAFRPGGDRFDPADDPTLRAVILGNWPRSYTMEEIRDDTGLNRSVTASFADNPDPVFYGLTGGDIVFIIIATILCSLLAFLMVFGFCIQPFFM